VSIKISNRWDCVLKIVNGGIAISFHRVPSVELVNELFTINENPGIEIVDDYLWLDGISHRMAADMLKHRERRCYFVSVSCNYEVKEAANCIATTFSDEPFALEQILIQVIDEPLPMEAVGGQEQGIDSIARS